MASIIRAPEFYGPSKLLGVNTLNSPGQAAVQSGDNSLDYKLPKESGALENEGEEDSLLRSIEQRNSLLEQEVIELQKKIEDIGRQSYDKEFSSGYQDGYKTCVEEVHAEVEEKLSAVSGLFENIDAAVQEYLSKLEEINVEIIFSAVCKIIGKNAENVDYVLSLVRDSVSKIDRKENIVVHFSPDDYRLLVETGNYDGEVKKLGNIQFIESEHIAHGGCLIDSKGGGLDARLETQLQQFKDMMLEVYSRRPIRNL